MRSRKLAQIKDDATNMAANERIHPPGTGIKFITLGAKTWEHCH